ncbi:hypothetical protein [Bacillus sp. FJAT-45037]|uniref:hypothetical protein n=1 Tax=Bacillus sp. FJAT-45037 TaxID=2011007 RepID=UPI0012FD0BDB|nr:hypothetical protein [Bacillus sp. FJAT-45037]
MRESLVGIVIFAIVTIAVFFIGQLLFGFQDGVNVLLGLSAGIIAEVIYRRQKVKG